MNSHNSKISFVATSNKLSFYLIINKIKEEKSVIKQSFELCS